ncbi:hypothetical protein FJT64_013710 [Amphibalanus amphitrite]|uniref:Uncharacterized protein n=1 Tax=Amphibalanus amphitrite TaxID=1232801 RepID=A0A6A4UVW2_AMPAM|nr:hypothetical protein FJT64_013710 [Amphibalanus amphitrite]
MSYLSSQQTTHNRPMLLLMSPVKASLSMEKTDRSIEAFTLEYTHSNQNDVRQSSLTFDTPGGRQNRRVSLRYMIDAPQKAFHVSLNTPIKSLELSGGLHLTGAEKHANVLIRLDDREVVNIKGSLTKDEYAAALRYRPQLAIRGPSGPVFSLSGNLNMNKDKHKYAIDLVISDLFETPVTLSGTVDETDGTYMLATSMDSYMLKGSLIGAFRYVGNEFEFRTNTKYTIFDGPQHTITVNTKMWQQVDGFGSVYNATMTTRVSMSTLHLGLM